MPKIAYGRWFIIMVNGWKLAYVVCSPKAVNEKGIRHVTKCNAWLCYVVKVEGAYSTGVLIFSINFTALPPRVPN